MSSNNTTNTQGPERPLNNGGDDPSQLRTGLRAFPKQTTFFGEYESNPAPPVSKARHGSDFADPLPGSNVSSVSDSDAHVQQVDGVAADVPNLGAFSQSAPPRSSESAANPLPEPWIHSTESSAPNSNESSPVSSIGDGSTESADQSAPRLDLSTDQSFDLATNKSFSVETVSSRALTPELIPSQTEVRTSSEVILDQPVMPLSGVTSARSSPVTLHSERDPAYSTSVPPPSGVDTAALFNQTSPSGAADDPAFDARHSNTDTIDPLNNFALETEDRSADHQDLITQDGQPQPSLETAALSAASLDIEPLDARAADQRRPSDSSSGSELSLSDLPVRTPKANKLLPVGIHSSRLTSPSLQVKLRVTSPPPTGAGSWSPSSKELAPRSESRGRNQQLVKLAPLPFSAAPTSFPSIASAAIIPSTLGGLKGGSGGGSDQPRSPQQEDQPFPPLGITDMTPRNYAPVTEDTQPRIVLTPAPSAETQTVMSILQTLLAGQTQAADEARLFANSMLSLSHRVGDVTSSIEKIQQDVLHQSLAHSALASDLREDQEAHHLRAREDSEKWERDRLLREEQQERDRLQREHEHREQEDARIASLEATLAAERADRAEKDRQREIAERVRLKAEHDAQLRLSIRMLQQEKFMDDLMNGRVVLPSASGQPTQLPWRSLSPTVDTTSAFQNNELSSEGETVSEMRSRKSSSSGVNILYSAKPTKVQRTTPVEPPPQVVMDLQSSSSDEDGDDYKPPVSRRLSTSASKSKKATPSKAESKSPSQSTAPSPKRARKVLDGNPDLTGRTAWWAVTDGKVPIDELGETPSQLAWRQNDPDNDSMRPDTMPGRLPEDVIIDKMGLTDEEFHDIWYRLVPTPAERLRCMLRFLPLPMTLQRRGALSDLLQLVKPGSEWPPAPVRFWQGRCFERHMKIVPSKQFRGQWGVELIRNLNVDRSALTAEELAGSDIEHTEVIQSMDMIYEGVVFRGTREQLEEQFPGHGEFAVQITTTLFIDAYDFRGVTSRFNFALDYAAGSPQRANASFVAFTPPIGLMRIHPVAQPQSELKRAGGVKTPGAQFLPKIGDEILLSQKTGPGTGACSSTSIPRLQRTQELIIALLGLEETIKQRNADSQYDDYQPKGKRVFTDLRIIAYLLEVLMTTTGLEHDTMGTYDLLTLQAILGRPYDHTKAWYALRDLQLLLTVQSNLLFNENSDRGLYSAAMTAHDMWPRDQGSRVCLPFPMDPLCHRRLMNHFTIGVSSDSRYESFKLDQWRNILLNTPRMRVHQSFHPEPQLNTEFMRAYSVWARNAEPLHSHLVQSNYLTEYNSKASSMIPAFYTTALWQKWSNTCRQSQKLHHDVDREDIHPVLLFDGPDESTYLPARWHYLDSTPDEYEEMMNHHKRTLNARLAIKAGVHGRLFHTENRPDRHPALSTALTRRIRAPRCDDSGISAEQLRRLRDRRVVDIPEGYDPEYDSSEPDDDSETGGGDPFKSVPAPREIESRSAKSGTSSSSAKAPANTKPSSSGTSSSAALSHVKKVIHVKPDVSSTPSVSRVFTKPREVHNIDASLPPAPPSINDDSTAPVDFDEFYQPDDDDQGGGGGDSDNDNGSHSSRSSASSRALRAAADLRKQLSEKDSQLVAMQNLIALINAKSNGSDPPPPSGDSMLDSKRPFGTLKTSSGMRLVPAFATWFPEGGYVPTLAQRAIMLCYAALHPQDLDIIESLRRGEHDAMTMKGSFDAIGPFANGQEDSDPQWQDYMRIFIRYIANGNGSITYGAMIKVLRSTVMYSAAVQLELQSVWDSETMYATEDAIPWHLKRCDISNFERSHKILCAICIFLCEKYHRFESLVNIMTKLSGITLKTSDWSGLLPMFNEQAALYRRLGATDRAACKLLPYVISGIRQCTGSDTQKMVLAQHFQTTYSAREAAWSVNQPGREKTELEVLTDTVAHTYNTWREQESFLPKAPQAAKGTKVGVKVSTVKSAVVDSDSDTSVSMQSTLDARDIDAMSPAQLKQFVKIAYSNFKPGGGGGQKDGGKQRDRDQGGEKKRYDPTVMEGRCFGCGMKTEHTYDTCPYIDTKKLSKRSGKPMIDFAKVCACTPPAVKATLIDAVFAFGRLKYIDSATKRSDLRTKLEASVWVADSSSEKRSA